MRATPTVMAQPDPLADRRARSAAAISTGVPDDPPQPADVEERLVDREPLDQRRGVVEHREHGPAGLACRPPSRGGTTTASGHSRRACAAAHRRAHPVRLGLVAGGQHHAAADDHRPAAQRRVVALLDRRVERVEVGVQDRGLAVGHEHMFAHGARGLHRGKQGAVLAPFIEAPTSAKRVGAMVLVCSTARPSGSTNGSSSAPAAGCSCPPATGPDVDEGSVIGDVQRHRRQPDRGPGPVRRSPDAGGRPRGRAGLRARPDRLDACGLTIPSAVPCVVGGTSTKGHRR